MASDAKDDEKQRAAILTDEYSQVLKNPYVILVGIENYKSSKNGLYNIGKEIKLMYSLLYRTYSYKNISIVYNGKASYILRNKYFDQHSIDILKDKTLFLKYFKNKKLLINKINHNIKHNNNKNNNNNTNGGTSNPIDGLILYFTGSGTKNEIFLYDSDNVTVEIEMIKAQFASNINDPLINLPKIMIFDSFITDLPLINNPLMNNNNNNKWFEKDNYDPSGNNGIGSCFVTLFIGNENGIQTKEQKGCNKKNGNGGNLTNIVFEVLRDPNDIKYICLRDLIVIMRKKLNGSSQDGSDALLIEFNEMLDYMLYFQPNQ